MKRTYLTLIIAMLVIGFAAVTTNLVINGTINFGYNQNDFDSNVVFTYAKAMNGTANINNNSKTITFETIKLENIDDEAILVFDVTNKSLEYDALITIDCGLEENFKKYDQYIDIKQSIEEKQFELESGATKNGTLTVTLKKAFNEALTQDVNMVCKLEATPEERDTKGTYTPVEHEYEEIFLKGADPVLEATPTQEIALAAVTQEKKLIPVKIGNNGQVTRADTTKEWYNYENKEWANAVILADGVEDPGIDQQISEEQIESYFVWIPKYRYKIQTTGVSSQGKEKAFEIQFGTEDTVDNDKECVAPNESGETGSCEAGKWMTHPAFTSFDVNGFWIGKFNVGYNQNNDNSVELTSDWTTDGAKQDIRNTEKVLIKPNLYSWNSINFYNSFYNAYNYARTLDSHITKNIEWGAVAYLTNSKYGVCEEDGTCAEVEQNNNTNKVTGYCALNDVKENVEPGKNSSNSVNYFDELSVKASSTHNYTGVYDISGGIYDQVSVISTDENNARIEGNGNYTNEIYNYDAKYFDTYIVGTTEYDEAAYSNRILGDAVGETVHWNGNSNKFISNSRVFLGRSDWSKAYKVAAGCFAFYSFDNSNSDILGYRIVLSPQ